ncbi:MAG: PEP-CTERM/exosortase system-associated acyltransferase [Alphaproteobacteria bacterium]|nr:PEP-CTERM/exosortase system-associated acyltransferase [Alphaproteobacteria bacterium]
MSAAARMSGPLDDAGRGREPREETLRDRYNRYFSCAVADTPELIRTAYQTRYQVYCLENAYENATDFPDGLETDKYDSHSEHSVLTYRPTADTIGTVRLILPDHDPRLGPAAQRILEYSGSTPFPLSTTAEVSRFSLCKRHPRGEGQMRRTIRDATANDDVFTMHTGPMMSLGLIQGAVRMTMRHRITHWCAIIEPRFLRMLAAMGIHFIPVGPLVEHHGVRQPCYCHVDSVLRFVRHERPSFWDVLTDGGALNVPRGSEGQRPAG